MQHSVFVKKLALWLLVIIGHLPTAHSSAESEAEWQQREQLIAESVAEVAPTRALAAAIVVKWVKETNLDDRIHAGLRHPIYTKDGGRASCFGQIHEARWLPHADWLALAGTDKEATKRCARATLHILKSDEYVCRVTALDRRGMERVFALYASGLYCEPTRASQALAQTWEKMLQMPMPRLPPEAGAGDATLAEE